jgi:inner membrane organizing system protein 1
MADNTPQPVAPISRTTRPMSEALLNEKVQPQDRSVEA